MTNVNMPRDDAANRIDPKAAADRSVKEVSSYPGTQPVTPHEDVTRAPPKTPRKQAQRRKKERRKKEQQILLDTRDGRDRRNAAQANNVEIEGENKGNGKTGIDVFS